MENYILEIITEHQKQLKKAEAVADLITEELGIGKVPEIRRYDKFPDAYQITFSGSFKSEDNFISEAIELTDRIASPWTVQFYRTTGEIELIFNKTENCRFRKDNFNVIRWAHLQVK